jgi:hypothetical protein
VVKYLIPRLTAEVESINSNIIHKTRARKINRRSGRAITRIIIYTKSYFDVRVNPFDESSLVLEGGNRRSNRVALVCPAPRVGVVAIHLFPERNDYLPRILGSGGCETLELGINRA